MLVLQLEPHISGDYDDYHAWVEQFKADEEYVLICGMLKAKQHEQHNKTSGSNASVLSFSFEERCVQAIDEELIQFIKHPNNPRWQKEKEEMHKNTSILE